MLTFITSKSEPRASVLSWKTVDYLGLTVPVNHDNQLLPPDRENKRKAKAYYVSK